jgi:hypothetical protein
VVAPFFEYKITSVVKKSSNHGFTTASNKTPKQTQKCASSITKSLQNSPQEKRSTKSSQQKTQTSVPSARKQLLAQEYLLLFILRWCTQNDHSSNAPSSCARQKVLDSLLQENDELTLI